MNNDDVSNPYAAPESTIADAPVIPEGEKRKLFSPTQGAAAAFLFGPLAGLYILQANFAATGDHMLRSKTIQYGAMAVAAFALATSLVPEQVPGIVFSVIYMILTRSFMDKYQHSKNAIADSELYRFQSNWLVFGIGMACIVVYIVILVAIIALLSVFGFVEPLW
jgi:hypothetical protein